MNPTSARTGDRVRIHPENKDLLERLGSSAKAGSPFRDQAHALVFAAALGYAKKRFSFPEVGDGILYTQIDKVPPLSRDLDSLLAISDAGGIDPLRDGTDADSTGLLEGYANGGLEYLREVGAGANAPLQLIADILRADHPGVVSDEASEHSAFSRD